MRPQQFDAIIVGAGPAGSLTGALLAERGFRVLVLDRAVFPRDKACGEYTSPQTERVLARTGALDAVLAAGGRRLSAMRVISPSGRTFTMEHGTDDGDGAGQDLKVLATTRRALDATLVEFARRKGACVLERAKVGSVLLDGSRAVGVRWACGQQVSDAHARIVIGADGIHSAVVRSLGVAAPVRWPRSLGMVAHYEGWNGLDDWGEMHVSRDGYAGLAPQSNGLLNVGLVVPLRRAGQFAGGGAAERFERLASSFPGVAERLKGARRVSEVRGAGPLGARVRRVHGDGWLLVGDAAGFFDPFTGEGVYKALRGAELAAQVAASALEENDVTSRRLSTYARLRRREFAAKEVLCRLVQLFVGVPAAMDYVVSRVGRRADVRRTLTGVLGDYLDPRAALRPSYLLSLLRP